ncbi:unnamed protein product [Rodentolepis nana]|uniref:Synembryn-A n=1 Tax=Rodentolepis nana TaxID=102285 RepID=A0A0R3T4L1_RODNA|nr:unnamed protein product [Rodentolepis nana]
MDLSKISEFRQKNELNFNVESIPDEEKSTIFSKCMILLKNQDVENVADALTCFLILSRDPEYHKQLAENDVLSILIREAGLLPNSPERPHDSIVIALKCLSNVLFKNASAIQCLRLNHCLDTLLERCESQVKSPTDLRILQFDIKLLFLCSALESASRLEILTSHFESEFFTDFLQWSLKADYTAQPQIFNITIDMLKFIFNLCYAKRERDYDQNLYEPTFRILTTNIRDMIVKPVTPMDRKMELVSHLVNFLTSVPLSCFTELLFPPSNLDESLAKVDLHSDSNVTLALAVLVDFLEYQLDQNDMAPARAPQLLSPILTVIATASKANRTIRKYFRMIILPPLGSDVKRLPESGSTLRNRLCNRLTAKLHNDDGTAEATALLIFILCKEKVDRAVKYSGFGNFVGFLSRHGLLARSSGSSDGDDGTYSPESSDSETEEYRVLKDQVNPVTGRVEPPRQDPMEGLSEEQKEYEAIQLVNKIDKLQR